MIKKFGLIAVLSVAPLLISTSAHAQLLGGLLDTVGDVVDTVGNTVENVTGGGVGDLASTSNGPAGSSGLVNIGLGDGGSHTGNLVDVNLGKKTVQATVRRNGGTVNGSLNLLGGNNNTLLAGLDLGGLGLNLGLGIGGIGGGGGGNGGNAGGPGNGSGGGNGGSGGASGLAFGLGQTTCSVDQGRQVLQIAADARFSTSAAQRWKRAANVSVIPLKVCASTKRQIAQLLRQSGKVQALQNAAAQDALIAASLSRTSYGADDIFAVDSTGGQLTVYVY